jgi:putative spermidine/putrescine transport system permease protein
MVRRTLLFVAGVTALFLMTPILTMMLVSLSPKASFAIPANALSLRWYVAMWHLESFWQSFRLSVTIGGAAALMALAVGIPLSFALIHGRIPGHRTISVLIMSPLMLPGVAIGIATMIFFQMLAPIGAQFEITVVHVVITLPIVVRIFSAGLTRFDTELLDAARTLGMSPARAVVWVMVPAMLPSTLAAAAFAFLTSFNNYSIALFLGNVLVMPLPVRMIEYFEQSPDPTMAAISSTLVLMTVGVLLLFRRWAGGVFSEH